MNQTDPSVNQPGACLDSDRVTRHILERIEGASTVSSPFQHTFIRQILPEDVYAGLIAYKQEVLRAGLYEARNQDSKKFSNRRYRLIESTHPVVRQFRDAFASDAVRKALFRHFYLDPEGSILGRTEIHREFEFVFCRPGLFQDIHVDIPPKVLSLVFYLPDAEVSQEVAEANATILYDRDLKPAGKAEFRGNSVCVFAPHFYSYHGFSTTIERHVLVMFYVDRTSLRAWNLLQRMSRIWPVDEKPFRVLRWFITRKLRTFPQIEYGTDPKKIALESAACLVNAPQGRVKR